jgi:hypothetical protein
MSDWKKILKYGGIFVLLLGVYSLFHAYVRYEVTGVAEEINKDFGGSISSEETIQNVKEDAVLYRNFGIGCVAAGIILIVVASRLT